VKSLATWNRINLGIDRTVGVLISFLTEDGWKAETTYCKWSEDRIGKP
jgi:hypothetical protein